MQYFCKNDSLTQQVNKDININKDINSTYYSYFYAVVY